MSQKGSMVHALRGVRWFRLQFSGVRLGTSAYNAFMAGSRGHWSLAMATFKEMGEKAENKKGRTLLQLSSCSILEVVSVSHLEYVGLRANRVSLNRPNRTKLSHPSFGGFGNQLNRPGVVPGHHHSRRCRGSALCRQHSLGEGDVLPEAG